MRLKFLRLSALLLALLMLTACGSNPLQDTGSGNRPGQHQSDNDGSNSSNSNSGNSGNNAGNNNSNSGNSGSTEMPDNNDAFMFTDRDWNADYASDSVTITLNGTSASCSGSGVQVKGSTITVTGDGTYILTGSFTGMVVVNAKNNAKPHLVLNNAHITSPSSAALYVFNCDKTVVTLAPNSENTLSNGGSFTAIDDEKIDGAIYAKQDLTLNGSGKLTVSSPVGHGMVCKDDLAITGGEYTVTSAEHGIDANDSIRVTGATMRLSSGKDGLHAENSDDSSLGFIYISGGALDIDAAGDGISAGSTMEITGGIFSILTGGGSKNASHSTSDGWGQPGGMGGGGGFRPRSNTSIASNTDDSTSIKGLKSSGNMSLRGGIFTIDSADDAIHANASVAVTGGTFTIQSGDDGFHADDTLTVSGGIISISKSYEGLEALHIRIKAGDISLVASDDGLNAAGGTDSSGTGGFRGDDFFGGGMGRPNGAGGMGGMSSGNGSIVISGGNLYLEASGDGLDANGTLEISGGRTVVCGPTQGDTAVLDYDKTAIITGGTFIGTGSTMMAQTFSNGSTQGCFAVKGSAAAGTGFTLTDSSGNVILQHTPALAYAFIILSSPEICSGQTYTITLSNGASGTFAAQ